MKILSFFQILTCIVAVIMGIRGMLISSDRSGRNKAVILASICIYLNIPIAWAELFLCTFVITLIGGILAVILMVFMIIACFVLAMTAMWKMLGVIFRG